MSIQSENFWKLGAQSKQGNSSPVGWVERGTIKNLQTLRKILIFNDTFIERDIAKPNKQLYLALKRTKMTQKIFSFLCLIVSLTLLSILGCGNDAEKPEQPEKPTTPEPVVSNEELLGTFDVVSINNGPPLIFLVTDEPDEEDRPEININHFYYEFAAAGSWTLNLDFEMIEFPEDPHREDPEKAGKVKIVGTWSGSYNLQNSVLSLIKQETDVDLTTVPQDFLQRVLDVENDPARQELIDEFDEHIFTEFQNTLITIEADTINLESTSTSKAKMVLMKR